MQSRTPILGTIVLIVLSAAAFSQAPQDRSQPQARPAPGNQAKPPQNGGNRPAPGGGGNARPQPSRPNPGTQPARPSPGKPGPGTQPARPNPGNRPQPGKPGGPQIQPVRPNPGNRPQPGRPQPGRPQPGRPQPGRPGAGRPPQWGHRPPNRPAYHWRPNDRAYLHRYYFSHFGAINRAHRLHLVIGGFFPYAYIPSIQPLPPDLYGYLPPPPPGYSMGYYEGYVVVYDPVTYFIANVIDILQ